MQYQHPPLSMLLQYGSNVLLHIALAVEAHLFSASGPQTSSRLEAELIERSVLVAVGDRFHSKQIRKLGVTFYLRSSYHNSLQISADNYVLFLKVDFPSL